MLDAATGEAFVVAVARAAGGAPVEVGRAATAGDRAFYDLGDAIVAIDRGGNELWRDSRSIPRDARRMDASGPQVANATWLVIQEATDTALRVTLTDAGTVPGDGRSADGPARRCRPTACRTRGCARRDGSAPSTSCCAPGRSCEPAHR
jgi:hypothetical protein